MCSIPSILGMEQNLIEIEQNSVAKKYDTIFYFKKRNIKNKLYLCHFKQFDKQTQFSSRIVGIEIGEVGLYAIANLAVYEYHMKKGITSTPLQRKRTTKKIVKCLTNITPEDQFSGWSFNAYNNQSSF